MVIVEIRCTSAIRKNTVKNNNEATGTLYKDEKTNRHPNSVRKRGSFATSLS